MTSARGSPRRRRPAARTSALSTQSGQTGHPAPSHAAGAEGLRSGKDKKCNPFLNDDINRSGHALFLCSSLGNISVKGSLK